MEAEDAFSMDLMGPSAEDRANGAALLSAALVRSWTQYWRWSEFEQANLRPKSSKLIPY